MIASAAAAAVALTVSASWAGAQNAPRAVTWPMRTMGTYANVTIVTSDSAGTAAEAARARLAEAEARLGNLSRCSAAWTRS